MRGASVALVVLVIALSTASAALAHARLVAVTPGNGAVLATAPADVRLVFDDPVAVGPGNAVVSADGRSVLAGPPRLERAGRLLLLPLTRIGRGDYSVSWRIVSDDGHLESGVLAFRVGQTGIATGLPRPVLRAATTGPGVGGVLARWLYLGGILVAGGTALFALLVSRAGEHRVTITIALALGGVVAGGAWLLHAAHGTATRFDRVTEAVAIAALLGVVLGALARVRPRLLPLALAVPLALLLAPSLAGHALRAWGGRPLSVAADLVHVGAAAFWIGGALQLALLLRGGWDERAARRFSLLTLPAVALLALSGLARALVELTAVSQLWSTGYGRAIVAKTALFCLLVVLGWWSRRALGAPERLRRSIRVELVLLVLVVGVVAVLTALRPGRDAVATVTAAPAASAVREVGRAAAPPAGAVVFAGRAQELAVGLAVRPGKPLRLTATVIGQTGNGVDGLEVRLSSGRDSGTRWAVAHTCGHGCYAASIPVANPLRFGVAIAGDGRLRSLSFTVRRWPPRPGGAFLRRATRSFRALHSVVFSEHLASDPHHAITTIWKLVAPGSVEYSIAGGAQGIVIGRRRWDRPSPAAPWKVAASERLVQPAPAWGVRSRDVRVLRETRTSMTLSWVDPAVPAWYTATFDRATALPRTLQMTAPAHFMRHRYLAYDTPVHITAPLGTAR